MKWLWIALLFSPPALYAADAALITASSGEVSVMDGKGGKTFLVSFTRLQEGGVLQLGNHARLRLVYFQGGQQETWQGPGSLEVGAAASRVVSGAPHSNNQSLSIQLIRQIAKTPTPDSGGKVAVLRTRVMAPSSGIEQVQKTYQDLRGKADPGDRNPELYLLSAYFEIREFDRVHEVLSQLDGSYPGDPEIKLLRSLYGRAIDNARVAAK